MKIWELVENHEFYVDGNVRILEYIPIDDEDGDLVGYDLEEKYDSKTNGEIPKDILRKDISSVNITQDGYLEIEYVNCDLY